jgi:hypothetical protein
LNRRISRKWFYSEVLEHIHLKCRGFRTMGGLTGAANPTEMEFVASSNPAAIAQLGDQRRPLEEIRGADKGHR